jgi:hypothetical protein
MTLSRRERLLAAVYAQMTQESRRRLREDRARRAERDEEPRFMTARDAMSPEPADEAADR